MDVSSVYDYELIFQNYEEKNEADEIFININSDSLPDADVDCEPRENDGDGGNETMVAAPSIQNSLFENPFDMLPMEMLPTPKGSKFFQNFACKRHMFPCKLLPEMMYKFLSDIFVKCRKDEKIRHEFPFCSNASKSAWNSFFNPAPGKKYTYGFDFWIVYMFLDMKVEAWMTLDRMEEYCYLLTLDDLETLKRVFNGTYGMPKTQSEEMAIYTRLTGTELTRELTRAVEDFCDVFDLTCEGMRMFQSRVDSRESLTLYDSYMTEFTVMKHHFKFVAHLYEERAMVKVHI